MTNHTLTIPTQPILSLGYALAPGTAATRYQRFVRYSLWHSLHDGYHVFWTDHSYPSAVIDLDAFGDEPFDEADYEDIYAHTHADDCDCEGCAYAAGAAAAAGMTRMESLSCDQ